ncbi:MAG: hypothetical protein JNL92_09815 [Opitutaceae bacterium]|nr:hypothetical protein [Opitutaceae bacterium]
MNAAPSDLHPLSTLLPEAEMRLTLRGIAEVGEDVAVECRYTAQRERDVKKTRTIHLVPSIWRIGSNDFITTQRDDSLVARFTVKATADGVSFAVPFHPPDGEHRAWGLHRIRIGRVEFDRWTAERPQIDPAFGLTCAPDALTGTVRPGGIMAAPLRGSLPLWPTLRRVDLEISPVCRPEVILWDPMKKHHWDGWRQTNPQPFPGGETFVARHVSGPTVWRAHDVPAISPGPGPEVRIPVPPPGAVPGIGLEVYWPEGGRLEFPEVRFDGGVSVLALPEAKLNARLRAILLNSVTRRPGWEMASVAAAEWREIDAAATPAEAAAVAWEVEDRSDGRNVLVATRKNLSEPWVFLFGADYDGERRVAIAGIMVYPTQWTGPLPGDL